MSLVFHPYYYSYPLLTLLSFIDIHYLSLLLPLFLVPTSLSLSFSLLHLHTYTFPFNFHNPITLSLFPFILLHMPFLSNHFTNNQNITVLHSSSSPLTPITFPLLSLTSTSFLSTLFFHPLSSMLLYKRTEQGDYYWQCCDEMHSLYFVQ